MDLILNQVYVSRWQSTLQPDNSDESRANEEQISVGTNLVSGPPEKFYRRNPSGTFGDVHWYHLGDPKKVPGAPSQGFLIFFGFDIEN